MKRFLFIGFMLFSILASAQEGRFGLIDAGGYIWIDSDATGGPAFEWIDITPTGTPVTGLKDDNVTGPYGIGFDFSYYGAIKNQFWINSDGCISFRNQHIQFSNDTIPTKSMVNDLVAWFWDDLTGADSISSVFYQSFGDSMLVVQFNDYRQYLQQVATITAEVILRSNGEIMVNYLQVGEGFITDSETIGIQSPDSTVGSQVAFNQPYVHDNLALLFYVDENAMVGTEAYDENGVIPVINLYPNPFSANLILQLDSFNHFDFVISIFNSRGVMIMKRGLRCESGTRNINVPTSGLPAGTYLIRIEDSKGRQVVERVIKI